MTAIATVPHWPPPSLTTERADAVVAYQDGVAALVAGAAHADALLREAVALDPTFALARVALAVAEFAGGAPFAPPDLGPGLTRGERQHVEVVRTAFGGPPARAGDLRREHLAEFPGDLLAVWLPALARATGP